MRRIALLLLGALPLFAQSPVVAIDPLNPVDGHPVAISWTQTVPSSLRFGTPTVAVSPSPYEWGWQFQWQPYTVTISQTATPEGNALQSVDRETVVVPVVREGVYSISLELTVGSAKSTFSLGNFAVAPPCAQEPSATARYSWDKSGYELDFADWTNANVMTGRATLVSIAGNHVTVRQSLTYAGIPSPRSSCLSSTVDLGAIAPGTYRLTWIYDEFFAPVSALAEGPTTTRELTFEAQLPKRRTSRR
jgi:hypothetical protein